MSPFPYTFICHQIEKYERLVHEARDRQELEIRLQAWFMWEGLRIKYFEQ
jgi:hypothetical protein